MLLSCTHNRWASLVVQVVKNLLAVRDSIPGLGRSLGEGSGNPLQCSLPGKSHEPRLWSMGSKRVRDDWVTNTFSSFLIHYRYIQYMPFSIILKFYTICIYYIFKNQRIICIKIVSLPIYWWDGSKRSYK